jgi:hypothetical protein
MSYTMKKGTKTTPWGERHELHRLEGTWTPPRGEGHRLHHGEGVMNYTLRGGGGMEHTLEGGEWNTPEGRHEQMYVLVHRTLLMSWGGGIASELLDKTVLSTPESLFVSMYSTVRFVQYKHFI